MSEYYRPNPKATLGDRNSAPLRRVGSSVKPALTKQGALRGSALVSNLKRSHGSESDDSDDERGVKRGASGAKRRDVEDSRDDEVATQTVPDSAMQDSEQTPSFGPSLSGSFGFGSLFGSSQQAIQPIDLGSTPQQGSQSLQGAPPILTRQPTDFPDAFRPSTTVNLPQVKDIEWEASKLKRDSAKYKTLTESMTKKAGPLKIKSKPNRGMITEEPEALDEQPDSLDFRGFRARQVLHHHSEVLKWHLRRTENVAATKEAREKARAKAREAGDKYEDPGEQMYSPVEVQSQYLAREGYLHLAVSANEPASQKYLRDMSKDSIRAIYEEAAQLPKSKGANDKRVRAAARKILEIRALNKRRLEGDKDVGKETPEDIDRSEALATGALDGRYSVVVNEGGRHAEQNLKLATESRQLQHASEGVDISNDETDVAGTFIRCGACSTELGPDEVYTHIHEQTDGGKHRHLTGTFYGHEMDPKKFAQAAPQYVGLGRSRAMTTGAAERARSRSPSPERKPPPKVTTLKASGALKK